MVRRRMRRFRGSDLDPAGRRGNAAKRRREQTANDRDGMSHPLELWRPGLIFAAVPTQPPRPARLLRDQSCV